jgi:hypothetical protein
MTVNRGVPGLAALGLLAAGALMTAQTPSPSAASENLCSIQGKVTNEATGEPVRNAVVILAQFQANPRVPSGGYTAVTDAEGRYEAAGIRPGAYRLMARKAGFLVTDHGAKAPRAAAGPGSASSTPEGATLNVTAGAKIRDLDFKLRPFGAIAGEVLSAEGEPLAGVDVVMLTVRYTVSGKQMEPQGGSAATNDLGEYRFSSAPPGQYYLRAELSSSRAAEAGEDRSAKPQREGYVPTLYPGTSDVRGATPVQVAPGKAVEGVNLRLVKAPVTRVRGRVTGPSGTAGTAGANIRVTSPAIGVPVKNGRTSAQGRFELRGLAPGAYTLEAFRAGPSILHAGMPLEVGRDPIEELVLTLTPPMEIPGSLRVEGEGAVAAGTRISLRQLAGFISITGNPSASPGADGSFRLTQVLPGRFEVSVSGPAASGRYLKSVRLGDQDATDGLDLLPGAAGPLEVVLSAGAAKVAGIARDEKGAPVAGAVVVLMPQEAARRQSISRNSSATADQGGQFAFADVAPGEYKAFAWADVQNLQWRDPDFMRPLESKGAAISVREGGSHTLDVRVIPPQE